MTQTHILAGDAMTPTHRYTRFSLGLVPLALVVAVSGCGSNGAAASPPASVSPQLQLVDRTTHALSTGAMKWVNGTYTTCTDPAGGGLRVDGTAWSAHISGGAMTNPALTVVKNDMACTLAITSIEADATYTGTPAVAIHTSYNGSASSFATTAMGPISFYANAKADDLSFANTFSLTVLFSDNLSGASSNTSATYASVAAPANGTTQVVSPDYTVSFLSFGITTDINQKVQTATGSVTVNTVSNLGEKYVINTNQTLGATFAIIDAAYLAGGTPVTVAGSIAASAFTLDPGGGSVTLPTIRNVIIAHTVSGVTSYEVIRITFNAAG
jgi:hypothetical protein